jgi:hypothetical protein
LRELVLISCTCRALATIVSKPRLVSHRLNQGEWVPTSMATRHRRILADFCVMAFLVVATLPSDNRSPFSPNTQ